VYVKPDAASTSSSRTAYSADLGDVQSKALPATKLRTYMLLYCNYIPNVKHKAVRHCDGLLLPATNIATEML